MEEKKDYTAMQEQLARFAKALGHPARIAIMHFLAKQKTCYFDQVERSVARHVVTEYQDTWLYEGFATLAEGLTECAYPRSFEALQG